MSKIIEDVKEQQQRIRVLSQFSKMWLGAPRRWEGDISKLSITALYPFTSDSENDWPGSESVLCHLKILTTKLAWAYVSLSGVS